MAGSAVSPGSRPTAWYDDPSLAALALPHGEARADAWERPGAGPSNVTLTYIILATLAGGLLSVLAAASLTVHVLGHIVKSLVSLSVGVLLGTALLQILPEAFESKSAGAQPLFATLLGGLMFFFLLEKAELYRHGHHHEGDDPHHHHHHGFDAEQAGRGGWSVLLGDSIHNFCDGIIIAAAFLTDTRLGVVTALAIIAHEIPQEVGDYIVLLNAGLSRTRALVYNALSGLSAVVGGVVGYFVVGPWEALFPYLLVIASSSFIYVAVADLLPQLQRRLPLKETLAQIGWIVAGLTVVLIARQFLH
jgi:zinc and cadmium transporter